MEHVSGLGNEYSVEFLNCLMLLIGSGLGDFFQWHREFVNTTVHRKSPKSKTQRTVSDKNILWRIWPFVRQRPAKTLSHINKDLTIRLFLIGGWSPSGSTRHGGHWLSYCSLPRVIMMVENLMEWRLARETEVLGENLPQRHFVHHKSLDQTRDRTQVSALGSQRLSTWAMARLRFNKVFVDTSNQQTDFPRKLIFGITRHFRYNGHQRSKHEVFGVVAKNRPLEVVKESSSVNSREPFVIEFRRQVISWVFSCEVLTR
jgi:hypothetical protein